jgi:hypothetical protein
MEPYFEMCKTFGIEPWIMVAKGDYRNVHNVPESVIAQMRARWEE